MRRSWHIDAPQSVQNGTVGGESPAWHGGWAFNYRDSYAYQDGNYGYDGFYIERDRYNYYFREGFRHGYEDGYYGRYRYGRYANGSWAPFWWQSSTSSRFASDCGVVNERPTTDVDSEWASVVNTTPTVRVPQRMGTLRP